MTTSERWSLYPFALANSMVRCSFQLVSLWKLYAWEKNKFLINPSSSICTIIHASRALRLRRFGCQATIPSALRFAWLRYESCFSKYLNFGRRCGFQALSSSSITSTTFNPCRSITASQSRRWSSMD